MKGGSKRAVIFCSTWRAVRGPGPGAVIHVGMGQQPACRASILWPHSPLASSSPDLWKCLALLFLQGTSITQGGPLESVRPAECHLHVFPVQLPVLMTSDPSIRHKDHSLRQTAQSPLTTAEGQINPLLLPLAVSFSDGTLTSALPLQTILCSPSPCSQQASYPGPLFVHLFVFLSV